MNALSPSPSSPAWQPARPKLLEQFGQFLRQRGTPESCIVTLVSWVAQFIRYHGLRHPRDLGTEQVSRFLERPEHSPPQRTEAAAALRCLYEECLPADQLTSGPPPTTTPFLNRCHEILRLRHYYSLRTEECYVNWIKRYIVFHGKIGQGAAMASAPPGP